MPPKRPPSRRRRSDRRPRSVPDLSPIDKVIEDIQSIIDWSIEAASPIGYFAALYKGTTCAIRKAIEDNRFEDGPRMVEFDEKFARRYFDAVNAHRDGKGKPTRVWQVAFKDKDKKKPLIILQQLMTAMNAHIDLDLGIVAADVGGASMESIHKDFNAVNTILASQVSGVLDAIDKVSLVIKEYRSWMMNADTGFVRASLTEFRGNAWKFACGLAAEPDARRTAKIRNRDAQCAMFGKWYVHPEPFVDIIDAIGEKESHDVPHNIEVLSQIASAPRRLPRTLY